MNKKKRTWVLLGILLVVSVGSLLFYLFRDSGKELEVCVDRVCSVYRLNEDQTVVLNGGTNTLVIKDGFAHMESAECPDKICMAMGYISLGGEAIICLPNEIVVQVLGDGGSLFSR